MAGSMGAVYDGDQPALPGGRANFSHGQDEGGAARNMAEEDGFCPGCDTREEAGDQVFFGADGQANRAADKCGSFLFTIIFPGPVAGAVFEIGAEDFVSGAQRETSGDYIHSIGRVGGIDDVVRVAADVGSKRLAGLFQIAGAVHIYKLRRFELQLALPPLIVFEDGSGTCTKCAIVKIGDIRIEEKG